MTANETERFEQFAAVLQTELLERTKKTLELLVPERQACAPLPFAQTPSFIDIYAEVVRVGIFPVVLSRRPVRAIMGDVDWTREGREYLLTVLDDRSNAVFTSWDYAWDALWDERKASASSASAQPERKKGFLSALFGRRSRGAPDPRPSNGDGDGDGPVMAGLYTMLNQLAEKKGFLPLFHDDIKVFKGLVRVKPARVLAATKELAQYHRQEFELTGHEQAKAGVLSDALQKWQFNLPDRIGEFLVLKAAVDFEHVNKAFVGKYIRQSARTQEEAERGMPYLTLYWKAMSHAVMPQD
ncbi:hypothetical protein [Azospirillum halopraeferens]|uniref:hypothetical protein n=1 Tax=Azospirillum halopraeferens TaxID=34010 RepID=UPI0003FA440B|nr:hypothetical protein [Azospirillum halopraeferens]